MGNMYQAPRLRFNGDKPKGGNFYLLPQQLIDKVFEGISGQNGNALKIMIVLLGTIGDGSFRVSEEWIQQRTHMKPQNYIRSRKYLVEEKHWLRIEMGQIIVDIDAIMNDGKQTSQGDKSKSCVYQGENEAHQGENKSHQGDVYNKEYNIITDNIRSGGLASAPRCDYQKRKEYYYDYEEGNSGFVF